MKNVLSLVLNADQTCGVPGCSILDNLSLIRDSLSYIDQKNSTLALIKIDKKKAFDRVNWYFLDSLLVKMNFRPIFRSFIQSVYNNVSSCVLNNGYKSRSFPLQRGVWQGFPLSHLLYCLFAETLGNIIRQNSKISDLHLAGTNAQAKISQYADGTYIFATDPRSVIEAMRSVKTFEGGSGSKVNLSVGKSEDILFVLLWW